MAKTRTEAREDLQMIANLATKLGYQVTFTSQTGTRGRHAGQTLTGITISILTED